MWNVRRRCLASSAFLDPSQCQGSGTETVNDMSGNHEGSASNESTRAIDEAFRMELIFMAPLLMKFPKCYWIWKYRLWVLQQAIKVLPAQLSREIWEEELGLVSKMLHRDQRNFHAWGYRRHVVAQLESHVLQGRSMVEAEFDYTTKMVSSNLSNFSAWHNRSQLIPRKLNETNADANARKSLLDQELSNVHEALNLSPEDQSLWYYHQYLTHAIATATGKGPIVRELSVAERKNYLKNEQEFLQDLLIDYHDVKWIYEAAVECILAADALSTPEEQELNGSFLAECFRNLKELDRNRRGRWEDIEGTLLSHVD
ncbi:Protein prenyltransferase [Moelleriella libera RCEF 2490]|uniref:Geranylgeranyl transferase type-2 subunit alpha n=1 Tax=Moelleriella libera RCEF 2490 TaxID=1081109 RepID=A0A166VHV8_9HYPO|nr:Protein prenyltransferase [Moelleriella libera RCEF 2490]